MRQAVVPFTLHQSSEQQRRFFNRHGPSCAHLHTAHLLWRVPVYSDNILKSAGTYVLKTSQLKYKVFLFLHRSPNFPSVYSGRFSKTSSWTKQHRLYKSLNHLHPLPLWTRLLCLTIAGEDFFLCVKKLRQVITACHTIHTMLFTQHNIHPHRHVCSLITAYVKIKLSWELQEKSLQNRTSNFQRCGDVYQYIHTI